MRYGTESKLCLALSKNIREDPAANMYDGDFSQKYLPPFSH